jgi:hypothetical protein
MAPAGRRTQSLRNAVVGQGKIPIGPLSHSDLLGAAAPVPESR